jgi:hypothetical protein
MAREAVDKHLQVAGAMIDPAKSLGDRLAAFPRMAAFYAAWYPTRWLGWGRWPRYQKFGRFAPHLRFVERHCRKLAREIFHGMLVHSAKLQRKQAFLFRMVDIANLLFAMAASLSRARTMADRRHPQAAEAGALSDLFCRDARRRVQRLFQDLWANDDDLKYRTAQSVLSGKHAWIEEGSMGLPVKPAKSMAGMPAAGMPPVTTPPARPAAPRTATERAPVAAPRG